MKVDYYLLIGSRIISIIIETKERDHSVLLIIMILYNQ